MICSEKPRSAHKSLKRTKKMMCSKPDAQISQLLPENSAPDESRKVSAVSSCSAHIMLMFKLSTALHSSA